jgi:probable rRNA maturation factor
MAVKLIVNRLTARQLPRLLRLDYWLQKSCRELMEKGGDDCDGREEGMIELNFVEPAAMRRLNREQRGIDRVTDVLSFSFLGQDKFPGDNLLGQIFIEPETAKKQAAAHGVSQAEEIQYLFVHGLLHVFGFDHETEADFRRMFGLQARIMPGPKWEIFADQIRLEHFGGRGAAGRNRGQ